MTFCLACLNCCEVCEMKLHLIVRTTNGTYGSGGLANSLGGASELRALTRMLPQQRAAVNSSLSFTRILLQIHSSPATKTGSKSPINQLE